MLDKIIFCLVGNKMINKSSSQPNKRRAIKRLLFPVVKNGPYIIERRIQILSNQKNWANKYQSKDMISKNYILKLHN